MKEIIKSGNELILCTDESPTLRHFEGVDKIRYLAATTPINDVYVGDVRHLTRVHNLEPGKMEVIFSTKKFKDFLQYVLTTN